MRRFLLTILIGYGMCLGLSTGYLIFGHREIDSTLPLDLASLPWNLLLFRIFGGFIGQVEYDSDDQKVGWDIISLLLASGAINVAILWFSYWQIGGRKHGSSFRSN